MENARVIIEVQAGIIPGEPMEEYTRRWVLTREQYESDDYDDARIDAANYVMEVQDPQRVSWVRFEWIWL